MYWVSLVDNFIYGVVVIHGSRECEGSICSGTYPSACYPLTRGKIWYGYGWWGGIEDDGSAL